MARNKIFLSPVQELIVGISFFNGIWIHLGVYLGEETWNPIFLQIQNLLPNTYLFWVLPFILSFVSILGSYFIGGWIGLVSIGFAFLGGFFINSFFGMILLIIGLFLGFFAPLRD